jgi:signal transduction histidine kinase
MRVRSLRMRLAAASTASLVIALVLAWIGLTEIFGRHVVRRVHVELEAVVRQLAANVSVASDGTLTLSRQPADTRFAEPLSGLYWQIEEEGGGKALRSRSLWDHALVLPKDSLDVGTVHYHRVPGRGSDMLLLAERRVILSPTTVPLALRIAAALDERDVLRARDAFSGDVLLSLVLLAAVMLTASWLQITVGLQPLEAIRRSVANVRSGRSQRLMISDPHEVMPLVGEINAMLSEKARNIEAAKARAADLAHGLKTPLTVLLSDAERLKQKGEKEISDEIEDMVSGMRRHIDRELSRARLQARARNRHERTPVRGVCERVIRTLSRRPDGEALKWLLDAPNDIRAAMSEDDLTELLGSILENACKWARKVVRVTVEHTDQVRIAVDDDGPGVASEKLSEIGQRGVRLDESIEGSGLGLAIATDIVEAYGGTLSFEARQLHGLRVLMSLPAAPDET